MLRPWFQIVSDAGYAAPLSLCGPIPSISSIVSIVPAASTYQFVNPINCINFINGINYQTCQLLPSLAALLPWFGDDFTTAAEADRRRGNKDHWSMLGFRIFGEAVDALVWHCAERAATT